MAAITGRFNLGGGAHPRGGESGVNFHALQQYASTGATGVPGDVLGGILGPRTNAVPNSAYDNVQKPGFSYGDVTVRLVEELPLVVKQGLVVMPSPFTGRIFPWKEHTQGGMDYKWRTVKFDQQVMGETPEEGNSGLISMSEETASASLIMRGQAFRMSKQLASTREGQEYFENYVRNIMGNMQMTADADVVRAIMDCHTMHAHWSNLLRDDRADLDRLLAEDARTFGSMSMPTGSDRFVSQLHRVAEIMGQRSAPDTLIVGSTLPVYMTCIPTEKTSYETAGPSGPARLANGPTSAALGTLVGTNYEVVKAPMYDAAVLSDAPEGMRRRVCKAEFYGGVDDSGCDFSKFRSDDRNLMIFDFDQNDFVPVRLRDMFKNSRLFENGHYSAAVERLASAYNSQGGDSVGTHHAEGGSTGRFFLLARDTMGKWSPIKLFGEMELEHLDSTQVVNIGMAAAREMCGQAGHDSFAGSMRLMTQLESQGYDATFAEALIRANIGRSAPGGQFSGSPTPADLARSWNAQRITEWTANADGGLDLPQDVPQGTVPFGYNSAVGLRVLASEARKPDSPYKELGQEAAKAVAFFESLIKRVQTAFPSSAALDPNRRPPWHHRPDPLATFIPAAMSGRTGTPLFMMAPGAAAAGAVPAASAGMSGGESWIALPGLGVTVPAGEFAVAGSREALIDALRTGTVPASVRQPAAQAANLSVRLPGGGIAILPSAAFNTLLYETDEVLALGAMPGGNSDDALRVRNSYLDIVKNIPEGPARTTFARSIYRLARQDPRKVWKVLTGISLTETEDNFAASAARLDVSNQAVARAALDEYEQYGIAGVDTLDTSATLASEWRGVIPGGAASAAALSDATVVTSDDIASVISAQRQLLAAAPAGAARDAAQRVFDTDMFGVGAEAAFLALGGSATETATITTTLPRVREAFDGFGAGADAARRAATAAASAAAAASGADAVELDLSPASVLTASYYRTPLVASAALLRDLSAQFGGQVAKPFVLPGDK